MLKIDKDVWKGTRSSFDRVMAPMAREHRRPKITIKMKGRKEDPRESRKGREELEELQGPKGKEKRSHNKQPSSVLEDGTEEADVVVGKKNEEKLVDVVDDDEYVTVSEDEERFVAPRRKFSQVVKGKKLVVRAKKDVKASHKAKGSPIKDKERSERIASSAEGFESSGLHWKKTDDPPIVTGRSGASSKTLEDKAQNMTKAGVFEEESEKHTTDEADRSSGKYSNDDPVDDEYLEVTEELVDEDQLEGKRDTMGQETERLEDDSLEKGDSGPNSDFYVDLNPLKRGNPFVSADWIRSRRAFVRKVGDEGSRTHAASGRGGEAEGDLQSKSTRSSQFVGASEVCESWVALMDYRGDEKSVLSAVERNFPNTFRKCTDTSLVGRGLGSSLAGLIAQLLCVTVADVTEAKLKEFLCGIESLESVKFQVDWLKERVELIYELKFGKPAQERKNISRAITAQEKLVEAAQDALKEARKAYGKARGALKREEKSLSDLRSSGNKLQEKMKSRYGLTEELEYVGDNLLPSLKVEQE